MIETSPDTAVFRQAARAAATLQPGLAWLQDAREQALAQFAGLGFPTTADEDWRYTDLTEAAARSREYASRPPASVTADSLAAEISRRLVPGEASAVAVFLDGVFRADLSKLPGAPGLTIGPLSTAAPQTRAVLAERIARAADRNGNGVPALNGALLRDGLHIDVAQGAVLGNPVYVVYAGGAGNAGHNRCLARLGRGSQATIIEHHISWGDSLSTTVTDIACEPESRVAYVKLQDESAGAIHLGAQNITIGAGARADLVHLDLGAKLARNDLWVDLAAEGGEVSAHGLFFADSSRHLDNHTRIDHRALRTVSREVYRGIVDTHGRGVFNGKVIVHRGADKTDAELTNQNLLLSRNAEVDTKPELEIYADDVKCSHGATTGQLDAAAIFYLRSRGIPADEARRMLIAAFAREIVQRVPSGPIADHVVRLLQDRLPGIREVAVGP